MHTSEDQEKSFGFSDVLNDLTAGVVVLLVALPLCLGIALASGAPLVSGLISGIVGGIIVGAISGSHTSVSGPAAGLVAIVLAQIAELGSFESFLFAVFVGGVIQIGLGWARAGALSAFFPSSVIRGLLAAIGIILILKQIPHLVGHDSDPEGEMSFVQPDDHNTFSELFSLFYGEIHLGATLIGIVSVVLLIAWQRTRLLRWIPVPAPLVVVLLGVVMQLLFRNWGEGWSIDASHLVQLPMADSFADLRSFVVTPDFTQWNNPKLYLAGVTIALVASLETLLNLEAVDKLDPKRRDSPGSRELVAQGVGNMTCGLIGGLPVTSVIVRSSVNVSTGAKSKLSTITHGILLLLCVTLVPQYLNQIPLASLAAILIVTGLKLAKPSLFRQMWNEGRYQFLPFIATLLAIVFTDLLVGILIGLGVSILFILNSNLRRPVRRIVETHLDGDVLHVELANQVSFLNRAALDKIFMEAKRGAHLLIDASGSDYIDPDVLSMIREFKKITGPSHGVEVSLRGFREKYQLHDDIRYADYSTRELRDRATPEQVLKMLREGNRRFSEGKRLTRNYGRQVGATAKGQNPLAVVLSCIDSRVPAELVFDLGIGDIFSVRVAGNVVGAKSLGSIEYGIAAVGVKLLVVLGHTRCGAVTSTVQLTAAGADVQKETGCENLPTIINEISLCIEPGELKQVASLDDAEMEIYVDEVARRNVRHTIKEITKRSSTLRQAVEKGEALIVGAVYDVKTGLITFLED